MLEYKADPKLVAEAHQSANEEIDRLDLAGLPPASVTRKKTTLITKAHSNRAKVALKGHYYVSNKIDQISYDLIPIDDMTPYACADVHYTWLLHMKFFHMLTEDSSLIQLYINEMSLCRMLFDMEQGGVKINRAYLEKIGPELYQEAHDAEQEVYRQVGYEFNVGSSQQLVEAIKSVGIKLTKYTKTSQEKLDRKEITEKECTFAADAQVLQFLAAEHSFAKAVLDYRGALKIKSTYIEGILDKLDKWDFIHSSFRQNVSTGRMSSSAPNLTNIPARDSRVKVAFEVPDDDHVFVFIDYSQIEVRIVAHYSQDPLLLSCYPFEGDGRDIHSLTGAEVILGVEYDVFLAMLHEKSDHKPDPHCTCNPCVATAARRIGKCVHPDTIVKTTSGYGSISDMYKFPDNPGEFLETPAKQNSVWDGRDRWAEVNSTYNSGEQKLLTVVTKHGIMVCTEDHLFSTEEGALIRAADLKEGTELTSASVYDMCNSKLYVPIEFSVNAKIPDVSFTPTDDWSYLAGVYAGDGTSTGDSVGICHGRVDTNHEYYEWNKVLVDLCTKMGLDPSTKSGKTADTIYLGSVVVRKLLKALEMVKEDNSRNLRVPSWIWDAGREACMHYLGGLIDTDGWVLKKMGTAGFCTKDPVFAGQVATLARACGLLVSCEASYNKTYDKHYFSLNFYKSGSMELQKYVRHPKKKPLFQKCVNKSKLCKNIVKLVEDHSFGPCIDLSLSTEDHLYQTNTLVTHNTVNFLIIYGGGGAVLQSQISTPDKFVSVDTCKGYINKYMRKYSGVKQWVRITDAVVVDKLEVQNLFGRYRRFPDINHVDDKGRYRRLRQAANFLVQGTAADLFKYALVRVSKFIKGTGIRIVNVVHDDIQFYFPKNKLHLLKDVVNIMEDFKLTVPIIADVDISTTTWAAKVAVSRDMLEDFNYERVKELVA